MSAQVDNSANVDDDAAAPVDVDTVKLHNFGLEIGKNHIKCGENG